MQFHKEMPVKISMIFEPGCNITFEMWHRLYTTYIDFDTNLVDEVTGQLTEVRISPVPGFKGVVIHTKSSGQWQWVPNGYLHTDGEFATYPQDSIDERGMGVMSYERVHELFNELHSALTVERGEKAKGCTCGTPPFAPPEPSFDCPWHEVVEEIRDEVDKLHHDFTNKTLLHQAGLPD